MRKLVMTAVLALSAGAIAYAQVKDEPMTGSRAEAMDSIAPQTPVNTTDARSLASDQSVGRHGAIIAISAINMNRQDSANA